MTRKERQRSCFGLTTSPHTLHQGHLRMHQRAWSEAQPRKGQGKKCVVLKSVFFSYNSDLFKTPIQLLSLSNVFCLIVTYKGFLPPFKPTVFHGKVSPSGTVRDQLGGDLVASHLSTYHSRIFRFRSSLQSKIFPSEPEDRIKIF